MKEEPPKDVPREGPIELQLLAIQRELSFFKAYYVEMNKKLSEIHETVGRIEHMELFIKITKAIDDHLSNRWEE